MLRKVLLTALTCTAMVFAQGGYQDGGSQQQQGQGGTAGQGQMMTIQGTIEDVNTSDSFFTIKSDTGTDTLYYNNQLNIQPDQLKKMRGKDVQVQYMMENNKKMAMMVTPAGQGGAAGQGQDQWQGDQGQGGQGNQGQGGQGQGGESDTGMQQY